MLPHLLSFLSLNTFRSDDNCTRIVSLMGSLFPIKDQRGLTSGLLSYFVLVPHWYCIIYCWVTFCQVLKLLVRWWSFIMFYNVWYIISWWMKVFSKVNGECLLSPNALVLYTRLCSTTVSYFWRYFPFQIWNTLSWQALDIQNDLFGIHTLFLREHKNV